MTGITPREWNQRIRRPWRVADTMTHIGTWFVFDDEDHQILATKSRDLALHLVELHNASLDK